ncbi:regulator of DNA class I crossover intermediates 1 isoform X3 [Anser cygnoides]|uniref:regulator of DNA class I crossover intermediates 1 isoform X3 n=1 Tax=Anser cygnoides TaxID=8845 RepID=UPI0034D32F6A
MGSVVEEWWRQPELIPVLLLLLSVPVAPSPSSPLALGSLRAWKAAALLLPGRRPLPAGPAHPGGRHTVPVGATACPPHPQHCAEQPLLLPLWLKMNWVGGSRSRVILKQERRKQKEFFEKKKLKSKMKLLETSSPKSSAVSLDLLNLYVVNQISTKKDSTVNLKKPVHIDITGDLKAPVRRYNLELPKSPLHKQYTANLDLIQNRLHEQVLDSRRQHLLEKGKYQHDFSEENFNTNLMGNPWEETYEDKQQNQPGIISDQDPWLSKHPSQCILRKSDTVPLELFKPVHRLDYMNSARKNPVIMTSKELENSEGIKEPLFGVVKETTERKAPQHESDCPFLALFEDESQSIHNNSSTRHFNPFVNQSSTANFFIDLEDRNQMTNRDYTYDTGEAHPAIKAQNKSIDRHLKGIFTAPEQVLCKNNNASLASYQKGSFHKTHLQDCHEGQHYFVPSGNKEKPSILEKSETFAYYRDQQINLKENVQNYSINKRDEPVKEAVWKQNQLFEFEEFATAQEEECKLGVSSNLHKMKKAQISDVESPLSSPSPSYSPRQTESCFSSSPDMSEEEDTAKKKYVDKRCFQIGNANNTSGSASKETPKASHRGSEPLQHCRSLTRVEDNYLQQKRASSRATEEANKDHAAPSEGSSLHQTRKKEHVPDSPRRDGWSQTESCAPAAGKADAATQCDTVRVCSCGSSLLPARSPGGLPPPGTAGTAGGHKMPEHEAPQPAGTGSAAGKAAFSSEAEYLSLADRTTLEVLNYIDVMKEREKQ